MFSAILTTYGLYSVISGLFFFFETADHFWLLLATFGHCCFWPEMANSNFFGHFFWVAFGQNGQNGPKEAKKNVMANGKCGQKWTSTKKMSQKWAKATQNDQKKPKMTKKKQPKRPKVAKSANSGPKKVTKAAQKWPRTAESSLREPKWPKKAKHKNHIIEDSEDFDAGRCRTMQSGTEQCGLMRETEGVWSQVLADDLLTNEASQSHPWLDCAQLVDMGISCGFGILLTFHAPALNVGDFVGECWHLWCVCQPNFPIWFFILPGFLCPFLCADHIGSPFPSHFYATPLRFFGIVVGKSLICMCIRLLL